MREDGLTERLEPWTRNDETWQRLKEPREKRPRSSRGID
jgi:hypothetical protein